MTFVLGDYRAIELIGAGGSARVWRGEVMETGAPVALKVFPADELPMARREAALTAAVDHPHVVRVVDVVGDDERAVLVTELAAGGDLADLLDRRGRLSPGETLTVLIPLAAALATAHERQIVHGDLSAQNILFDRAGRPLLADLGAGRAAAEGGGSVAATPTDAAPELARGGTPCAATDMFSLGSLALACLTGRHAWPADDLRDVLIQAAAGQWPDPSDDDGPPLLISAVRGLLEHDAERRPGAASLVMDLRAAGRPEPLDLRLGAAAPRRATVETGIPGALVLGRGQTAGEPAAASGSSGASGSGASGSSVPAGGRHGFPPASSRGTSNTVHRDDHLDLGRSGRARAVTRIRPDTPAPPVPRAVSRLQRVRALSRPGAGGSSSTSRARQADTRASGRRALRIVVIAMATLVVAGLAGAGGLWWARWDRTDPVALDRMNSAASAARSSSVPAAAADAPVRDLPTGTPAIPTSTSGARTPTLPPSAPRSSALTTTARPSSVPTEAARPTTAGRQSSARSVAAGKSVPPISPSQTPGGSSKADSSRADSSKADFTETVRDLDDARARALVARDASLLDAVYTSDSAARSVDVGMIESLISRGLRLSGAEHVVRSTRVVGAAPLRVEVDDSLPSYSVLDAAGSIVGSTTSRSVSVRVLVLVKTPTGYRIGAVQSG